MKTVAGSHYVEAGTGAETTVRGARVNGALRHTFATVADDYGDTNARRLIMGHGFAGMDAVYVSGKRMERLREVVELVRHQYINLVG